MNPTIAELTQAVEQEADKFPQARRLMTHPGVGALTALAFVLIIGKAERDSTGSRLFVFSITGDCTVPGMLSVYSVSTQGQLRATGVTAQTAPCPTSVVVTK